VKSKPSANFTREMLRNLSDHGLKQRASQMWLLMRVFPFIMFEKVERGDRHMQPVLLLLRIMEIVFAPKLTRSIVPYLRALIQDYKAVFMDLFGRKVNRINKAHHLEHYPECILRAGPLILYWCMRFEAKHQVMKKHANVVCNFKNPPKTLARLCQATQACALGKKQYQINTMRCVGGKKHSCVRNFKPSSVQL